MFLSGESTPSLLSAPSAAPSLSGFGGTDLGMACNPGLAIRAFFRMDSDWFRNGQVVLSESLRL